MGEGSRGFANQRIVHEHEIWEVASFFSDFFLSTRGWITTCMVTTPPDTSVKCILYSPRVLLLSRTLPPCISFSSFTDFGAIDLSWGHSVTSICLRAATVVEIAYVLWAISVPSKILNLISTFSSDPAMVCTPIDKNRAEMAPLQGIQLFTAQFNSHSLKFAELSKGSMLDRIWEMCTSETATIDGKKNLIWRKKRKPPPRTISD